MLHRNIDTRSGLVNGQSVQWFPLKPTTLPSSLTEYEQLAILKSKFMVLKNIYAHRKQFLAFAVTVHKCQGLSLDCAMMDLSHKVSCAGMAYVALSQVKKCENLHLIAFTEQVSSKYLIV